MYDARTKECQCCTIGYICYTKTLALGLIVEPDMRNERIAVLMQILNEHPNSTAEFLKQMLEHKCQAGGSIFQYLQILKSRGLVDVRTEGRKKLYELR